ncbi:hypothetical protein ABT104_30875, partial [Streptomyces mobaraensis]
MGRRGVPRTLTDRAPLTPGRELAHGAIDSARDVLHPVITIGRGLRSLAAAGRRGWGRTPRAPRGAARGGGAAGRGGITGRSGVRLRAEVGGSEA